jgi:hypothetical protein
VGYSGELGPVAPAQSRNNPGRGHLPPMDPPGAPGNHESAMSIAEVVARVRCPEGVHYPDVPDVGECWGPAQVPR